MNMYMAIGAAIGWIALFIQFYLTITYSHSIGLTTIEGVITFFSYFTIQNNFLVAICYTVLLLKPESGLGKFFSKTSVKSGIAVYITIVGLVYSLLLRYIWNPEGWGWVADELLHDVAPVFYIIYWLIFVPKGVLRWKNALVWLIYPAFYLTYVMIRGASTGRYPYPFIDGGVLGFSDVVINIIKLMFAFLGLGLIYVGLNRLMGERLVKKQEI